MAEETREIPFRVPHGEPRKTIRGTIRVAGEEVTAEWLEWYPDYGHRVLKVIGDTLGYPVMGSVHDAGHGRCSVALRRATPGEAATIARIAACEKVDQRPMPPYARLEEMRQDFEGAGVLPEAWSEQTNTVIGPMEHFWWTVDVSNSDRVARLSEKWTIQAEKDCLAAAREGKWREAYFAAELAVGEAPAGRRAEAVAFHVVTTANWKAPEHTVPAEERLEETVADFCRSYGADFACELQRQIDRLSCLIGFAGAALEVKEILRSYLARHPKDRDSRLAKIVEEK
jgi:hypothetical protein